jgi:peptidoglycan/xylan/chitin deacetylase (PgdA/CDA1 family)
MPNRLIILAVSIALVAAPAIAQGVRPSNEMGRVPILEYHLIADKDSRWGRSAEHFRHDLELLYARGYRPITVAQLVDKKIEIPAGTSPVVFTFDDASPGQFRYIEKNGQVEIDPNSGVGIWLDFHRKHPDWGNRATFCLLSGAAAGHAFFGEKGIEGQKTEWRFKKVKFLADQGFELCGHTLWHANLAKYSDAVVQEQIARGVLAIDSAVPGYKVRTLALPLGIWPKNRTLASRGVWHDPKGKRDVPYAFDAILEVSGPPAMSPMNGKFNPRSLPRIQMIGNDLEKALDQLDKTGERYVTGSSAKKSAGGNK